MTKSNVKITEPKLLTETELELMNILWRLEEGTVAEVIELLPKERDLAYTSVSTILRILEQKGILKIRKEGRGHIYIPQLKKNDYEAKTVKHIVNRVFDGTPVALVRQLLDSVKLNKNDLKEIRDLIDQASEKK
ncbi:MAG: BlaI/MecI/CopY family transcriptional regulator [Bdellovibrionota bacterium]